MARRSKKRKRLVAKATPGYEGRFELGSRLVDDPYAPGSQIRVPANVKASTLSYMQSRGRITEVQFRAGEWFRATYERAIIGACGAIDYARVRVDGGKLPDTISTTVMEAHKDLAEVARLLANHRGGYSILAKVAGEGLTLSEAAYAIGMAGTGWRVEKAVSERLVEILDMLVVHLGFVATGSPANIIASGPIAVTGLRTNGTSTASVNW